MKFLTALRRAGTTRYLLFNERKYRYVIRNKSAVLKIVDGQWFGLNLWWPSPEEHESNDWKVGEVIWR